ncbi:MAG: cytochrome c peroxidase [Bacteroidota bacterium]
MRSLGMLSGNLGVAFLLVISCGQTNLPDADLIQYPYSPTPAPPPELPYFFPEMTIPANNPQTVEGIELGRHLFYDPILSIDNTISCASCHQPEFAFSDSEALSRGVDGQVGFRNAMSLVNVGFFQTGLFWDGRVKTLEAQSLHPIRDPLEMGNSPEEVEDRMRKHERYPQMFRAAFGIEDRSEITIDLVTKAIAQFERTIISSEAKFDYANWDRGVETRFFSPSELRGQKLFNLEPTDQLDKHPGCSHCHSISALGTTQEFFNNGLDPAPSLTEFPDLGVGGVTGTLYQNGTFRVPSLRNVALTAPYMHDGRFSTLEEVVDHYASGGHYADNVDANIQPFTLSEQDQADLIAFMHTLTDTISLQKPALQSPF